MRKDCMKAVLGIAVMMGLGLGMTSCSTSDNAVVIPETPDNPGGGVPSIGGEPGGGGKAQLIDGVISLDSLDYNAIIADGSTLTGTLKAKVKISIADSATVTLNGATINGDTIGFKSWAGLTCLGSATIVLADNSKNTVTGIEIVYPAIQAGPKGTTLTITGTGKLTASSDGVGAGIGGAYQKTCGNITITGGDITAISRVGAGIGSGNEGTCGDITISGGTVTSTSNFGAGIGCGTEGTCGDITITKGEGFVGVTATKGLSAHRPIGLSSPEGDSYCGKITFGGEVIYDPDLGDTEDNAYYEGSASGGLIFEESNNTDTWKLTAK